MLSNTALKKPRPKALGHDAAGKCCTGIMDAHITKESKKVLPLSASGSRLQAGARHGVVSRIATHTAMPMTGKLSNTAGWRRLKYTLAPTALSRMMATMQRRAQWMWAPLGASFMMGW